MASVCGRHGLAPTLIERWRRLKTASVRHYQDQALDQIMAAWKCTRRLWRMTVTVGTLCDGCARGSVPARMCAISANRVDILSALRALVRADRNRAG